MIFDLGLCLVLFWGLAFGLAWPIARRLPFEPVEKVVASAALSMLLIFLAAWTIYAWALPLLLFWILPTFAAIGLIGERRTFILTIKDPQVGMLLKAQMLVTAWSIGLLALVLNYSGGEWVADWWEHLQRTAFFLDRGPRDILFIGFDPLTSRPPLANIVTGVFLQITHRDFVHYQFFSTQFASLTFLPAGLLARRYGGNIAISILVLLFMVNPMFAQNVTYSWTKLPAAFFVLTALYFFLRACDPDASSVYAVIFALTLATGLLTHYSAGPCAVLLAAGWMGLGWQHRHEPGWRRFTGFAVLSGTLVLATWIGWCLSVYGIRGTFLTNSSVTDAAPEANAQLRTVILNIRDTLVPHFLRSFDPRLIAQSSPIGRLRDWFFLLYQLNFFFVFGSAAWCVIAIRLIKQTRDTSWARRFFWLSFIIGSLLVGVAVVGIREVSGLAHICLQPLVITGLAFLAAQWPQLTRPWRLLLIAGATVDFVTGIGLQFAVESFAFERWFSSERSIFEIVASYSRATEMNFHSKIQSHWLFLGDVLIDYGYAIIVFLVLVILCAIRNASSPGKDRTASTGS